MATKMYIFNTVSTVPTGWTKTTTWDGKYVRFNSSTANHGTLGGQSTHKHESPTITIGNNNPATKGGTNTSQYMAPHSHATNGTFNCSDENNDPLYYTLMLISMDLADWETYERRIPQNAAVMSAETISWSDFTRYTDPDGRLIKLGAPGGTGGRSVSSHSVYYALPSSSNPQDCDSWGSSKKVAYNYNHGHNFNGTSNEATTFPKRIKTRIYKASINTTKVPVGVIVFMDGTPSSKWDLVSSWDGNFLLSGDFDAVSEGSDTHTQTASGNSDNGPGGFWTGSGTSDGAVPEGHYHAVTIELNSVDHKPPYVNLVPYSLNTELLYINHYSKSYSFDILMKRIGKKTPTFSIKLKKAGTAYHSTNIVLSKKDIQKAATANLIAMLPGDSPINMDLILKKGNFRSADFSIRLMRNHVDMTANLRIIKPNGTVQPVLETILTSIADQIDKIQMKIQLASMANKLTTASGSEIDDLWGKSYNLPRFAGEDDVSYKLRIALHTPMVVGSGTAPAVGTVVNTLLGIPEAVSFVTVWPATVRIYFKDGETAHIAKDKEDLLTYFLPRTLAAGINYEIFYNYADYTNTMRLQGYGPVQYFLNIMVQQPDLTKVYYEGIRLMLREIEEYSSDLILKNVTPLNYIGNLIMYDEKAKQYVIDLLLQDEKNIYITADLLLKKKNKGALYWLGLGAMKFRIRKPFKLGFLMYKTTKQDWMLNTILQAHQTKTYGTSIKLVVI